MPRQDGRIEPGQKLSSAISARAWNRAQQAADIVLGATAGTSAGPATYPSAPYTWVYAKNNTSSDIARWGVMGIGGVEVTPTTDATARPTRQFEEMPVLTGVAYNSLSTGHCVAVEPIKKNSVGRVAVSGAVQIKAADTEKLSSKSVLWKNDDWALVVLGGGGGGGIKIATFSGSWPAGGFKDVTFKDSTTTAQAKNLFYNVGVDCGSRDCAIAQDGGTWYLLTYNCT